MLTDEQRIEIIKLKKSGYGSKRIATQLNIKRDQVRSFYKTKLAKELDSKDDIEFEKIVLKEKPIKQYECKYCKKLYIRKESTIGSVLYCSFECKNNLINERKRLAKIDKTYTCQKCGKEFIRNGSQIFCSDECRYEIRICEVCGKQFKVNFNSKIIHCSKKCAKDGARLSHQEYYDRFSKIHKGSIVPITKYIGGDYELTAHCLECGKTTIRRASEFIDKNKQLGCKNCNTRYSTGEKKIEEWLIVNGINYQKQYTFDDLKDTNALRFDFAILNDKQEVDTLIEYNGRQHYEPVSAFGGVKEYQRQQRTDGMKLSYVKDNGYKLIVINHKQKNYIEKILEQSIPTYPAPSHL